MSSCEYCEVFINTYFEKHLWTSLIWKHFFFLITINSSCLKPIYRKNAQFLWCARKWFPWFLRWLRTIVKHFWSHRENRFQLYFWHEWGRLSIILAHLKLLQWMLNHLGVLQCDSGWSWSLGISIMVSAIALGCRELFRSTLIL